MSDWTIDELKKITRTRIRTLRASMTAEEHASKSEEICLRVIRDVVSIMKPGSTLFTFMPMPGEADVTGILEHCWSNGIPAAVPKVEPSTRDMTFHYINSYDDVQKGRYGIREPLPSTRLAEPLSAGLLLVPGLAFDAAGRRLGMGGGYYDRFMEKVKASGLLFPVAAPAYELQLVEKVPFEAHDLVVNMVITERKSYHFHNFSTPG
ncbi:5-formyltetrahydrofolate cyclo-ligase [Paenibacillus gansuensis]|uniref:5-formyltetrahydrofolate cyclo-ligase n=1 Tax=Paenibacillus gansuensis TaxID=306542 RepID=A0ABW5PH13_9BACL